MTRRPALQQLCSPEFGCLVEGALPESRLIAMGSPELTEGFSLIGFETLPNASAEELDELLDELLKSKQKALILVEDRLARSDSPLLRRVRTEGGRIVVAEIPPLHAPGDFRPEVEDMVLAVLGAGALEDDR